MHLLNNRLSGRNSHRPLFSNVCSVHIRRFSLTALLLAAGHGASFGSSARADEFSLVPAGDPLYKHFTTVRRAQWNDTGITEGARSDAARPRATGAAPSLTRYEMALETARAYLSVSTRSTTLSVSRPALRSLRELMVALRGELRSLDIDVSEALSFCDRILQRNLNTPAASAATNTDRASSVRLATPPSELSRSRTSILESSAPAFGAAGNAPRGLQLPISQRLRLEAALSSLEREAGDPFGDAASRSSYRASEGTSRMRLRPALLTGGTYEVTDWLRLRADYARRPLAGATNPREMLASTGANASLSPLLTRSLGQAGESRSVAGGVDIAVSGLTFSGQVARVSTNGAGPDATRFGGGVALNAWQNRLVLSANLSRLVPEDSPMLSSEAAALNLDVGVTERLRLRLLYQQLFNSPSQNRGERLVAGGINISF